MVEAILAGRQPEGVTLPALLEGCWWGGLNSIGNDTAHFSVALSGWAHDPSTDWMGDRTATIAPALQRVLEHAPPFMITRKIASGSATRSRLSVGSHYITMETIGSVSYNVIGSLPAGVR
jgi:hypothetical protein